jgi:transcriptional regulator with XRE-family HTH domain
MSISNPNWQGMVVALHKSGMTQTEIANKTGISQSFVSNLFKGKRVSVQYGRGFAILRLYHQRVLRQRISTTPLGD